jgi:hypothetical protein
MSGLQNVRLQKNIHTYSVLVVGGNPQVLLQPCLQVSDGSVLFSILEVFLPYIAIISKNDTLFTLNRKCRLGNSYTFCFLSISNLITGRFETRPFEPDVLKPDVLKPDIVKPDVMKPDVLWVYHINQYRTYLCYYRSMSRQVCDSLQIQSTRADKC